MCSNKLICENSKRLHLQAIQMAFKSAHGIEIQKFKLFHVQYLTARYNWFGELIIEMPVWFAKYLDPHFRSHTNPSVLLHKSMENTYFSIFKGVTLDSLCAFINGE